MLLVAEWRLIRSINHTRIARPLLVASSLCLLLIRQKPFKLIAWLINKCPAVLISRLPQTKALKRRQMFQIISFLNLLSDVDVLKEVRRVRYHVEDSLQ